MKETRLIWDMPVTINIDDDNEIATVIADVFRFFKHVDSMFNIFQSGSIISRINRKQIPEKYWNSEIKEVLKLCEKTGVETNGYFQHLKDGIINPLGIVKGWAVKKAADKIASWGINNFYIEAGGDIEVRGLKRNSKLWTAGIRNPFNRFENVKTLQLTDCGIATSGSYIRGNHIYNPHNIDEPVSEIVSLTVIAKNILEADRYATSAFAMGKDGIYFIEKTPGLEGYLIDANAVATETGGFSKYTQ